MTKMKKPKDNSFSSLIRELDRKWSKTYEDHEETVNESLLNKLEDLAPGK